MKIGENVKVPKHTCLEIKYNKCVFTCTWKSNDFQRSPVNNTDRAKTRQCQFILINLEHKCTNEM